MVIHRWHDGCIEILINRSVGVLFLCGGEVVDTVHTPLLVGTVYTLLLVDTVHTLLFVNAVHSLLLNTEYNAMIIDGQHTFTFTDNVLNIFLSYRKWLLHATRSQAQLRYMDIYIARANAFLQQFYSNVRSQKLTSGQEYRKLLFNKFSATYQWLLFTRYFAYDNVQLQVLKLIRKQMWNIVRKHDYHCISLASLQPKLKDIFRKMHGIKQRDWQLQLLLVQCSIILNDSDLFCWIFPLIKVSTTWDYILTKWIDKHRLNMPKFYITRIFPMVSALLTFTNTRSSYKFCNVNSTRITGGGRPTIFSGKELQEYSIADHETNWNYGFNYIDHVDGTGLCKYPTSAGFVHVDMPLRLLVLKLAEKKIRKIGQIHTMQLDSHDHKAALCKSFEYHDCVACNLYRSVFLEGEVPLKRVAFPPAPLCEKVTYQVISNFCNDTQSELLQEAGCAVCGRLVPIIQMSKLSAVKNLLHILDIKGVTRKERKKTTDEITEKEGPVLNNHSDCVCDTCRCLLRNNKMPH